MFIGFVSESILSGSCTCGIVTKKTFPQGTYLYYIYSVYHVTHTVGFFVHQWDVQLRTVQQVQRVCRFQLLPNNSGILFFFSLTRFYPDSSNSR